MAVEVGVDLVAAEQVGLGERTDVADADRAAEQLADRREHHDLAAPAPRRQLGELADQLGAGAGDGDDHAPSASVLSGHRRRAGPVRRRRARP